MTYHRMLILSDMHCGNISGLTPPEYIPPIYSKWLTPFWDWYVAAVAQVGPVDDLIVNGDALDGPGKKETTNLLTTDVGEQQDMADTIIGQVDAKRVHMVRGTPFHSDGDTAYEDGIGEAPIGDDLRVEVRGRKFLFRHVCGRSDTDRGQFGQVAKELTNEILQSFSEGYDTADVLVRSHVHYHALVAIPHGPESRMHYAFTTPSLELRGPRSGSFVRKLRTWLYHVGIVLVEVDEVGEVFIRPIMFPLMKYMADARSYKCLAA